MDGELNPEPSRVTGRNGGLQVAEAERDGIGVGARGLSREWEWRTSWHLGKDSSTAGSSPEPPGSAAARSASHGQAPGLRAPLRTLLASAVLMAAVYGGQVEVCGLVPRE